MKTTSLSAAVPLLVLVATILCCRSEEPTAPQETPYIPLITNRWIDVANPNHTFGFQTQQESVQTGTFTGFEDSVGTIFDTLAGNFSNRNISFIVRRRGRDTTYSGRFVLDTLIDFNGLKLFRR